MLTIDFKVNGHTIMVVHAQNRGPARSPRTGVAVDRYTWAVERRAFLEYEPPKLSGEVVHAREDGAPALAAKILEQAGLAALPPSEEPGPWRSVEQQRIEELEQVLDEIRMTATGGIDSFVRRNGQRAIYVAADRALRGSARPASDGS